MFALFMEISAWFFVVSVGAAILLVVFLVAFGSLLLWGIEVFGRRLAWWESCRDEQ